MTEESKARHTPGPWGAGPAATDVFGKDGSWVCRTSTAATYSTEKQRANARLIAAAPEMLEALKELADSYYRVTFDAEQNSPEYQQARAAIAKAAGTDD